MVTEYGGSWEGVGRGLCGGRGGGNGGGRGVVEVVVAGFREGICPGVLNVGVCKSLILQGFSML